MKIAFWLLMIAFGAALAWMLWYFVRKSQARKRAEEERLANFVAGNAAAAETLKKKPAKD
ncbi:MAG TPA: hypothetical protein VMU46_02605 [Burkholderiales bacterium]|nr:hypothetical protein [Burkholderiales bacterium]